MHDDQDTLDKIRSAITTLADPAIPTHEPHHWSAIAGLAQVAHHMAQGSASPAEVERAQRTLAALAW